MKGRAIKYDPDKLAWIKANSTLPRAEAHALFCARFMRPEISLPNFNSLCKRKGWMTGRDGRIMAGSVPHNKGRPMPSHPNSAATQFKKGNLPHTYRGHGHERICKKDGYVVMRVAETNPWSGGVTRPVHKHRWLWEQKHGPIPAGYALKCLDGDKTNCDPSNWELIPRGMLPRLNGGNRYRNAPVYDAAPAELKPSIMAVAKLEQAAREARK